MMDRLAVAAFWAHERRSIHDDDMASAEYQWRQLTIKDRERWKCAALAVLSAYNDALVRAVDKHLEEE